MSRRCIKDTPPTIRKHFVNISTAQLRERSGKGEVEIPSGWFAISHSLMERKDQRRCNHGRWFRISNNNGNSVHRALRFNPHLSRRKGEKNEYIVIDWSAWLFLAEYAEKPSDLLELEVVRTKWWELPSACISHPDPGHRLASYVALLSAGLGILSIVLALAGIMG